jgi:hypothetical protein
MGDDSSISFNDFDVDGCNISEVILFLQNLSLSPNASSINIAFTNHITNALMKIREEVETKGFYSQEVRRWLGAHH